MVTQVPTSGPAPGPQDTPAPFSLGRSFATLGLLAIALPAVAGAVLLSQLFKERLLQQEARLSMQFVQGIVDVESAAHHFLQPEVAEPSTIERLLARIGRAPDVLRANLYSRQRRLLWSSDPALATGSFEDAANRELDAALAGSVEIHEASSEHADKAEHENLGARSGRFIELYLPVRDARGGAVVGAVELYRDSGALHAAIGSGVRLIWAGAFGAAALLFVALYPLVRRADRMIRAQQDRIVEAETLAVMGDIGSAVAHGLRNPLAVIRSSAELVQAQPDAATGRQAARDIVEQVDRLDHWVRTLLTYVHLPAGDTQRIDLETLARQGLAQFATEIRRRGIETAVDFGGRAAAVRGDALLIGQMLGSLLANAVEAMPDGGRLAIEGRAAGTGWVRLVLTDTGAGMDAATLARALKPFQTTKPRGFGIGLPLARRIARRMGGGIELSSAPGAGTAVTVTLPEAGP